MIPKWPEWGLLNPFTQPTKGMSENWGWGPSSGAFEDLFCVHDCLNLEDENVGFRDWYPQTTPSRGISTQNRKLIYVFFDTRNGLRNIWPHLSSCTFFRNIGHHSKFEVLREEMSCTEGPRPQFALETKIYSYVSPETCSSRQNTMSKQVRPRSRSKISTTVKACRRKLLLSSPTWTNKRTIFQQLYMIEHDSLEIGIHIHKEAAPHRHAQILPLMPHSNLAL